MISLEYCHLNTESYTQNYSDGSTPAYIETDNFNVLELGTGVRLSHLVKLDNGTFARSQPHGVP